MNILMLGMNDPAGMMIAFANALNRYTEHTARVVSMRTVYAIDFEYDIELPRIENDDYSEVEHLLKTSDIFHFHMLLDENYQLGPLEIRDYVKGKALLHHHHGTYDHQVFLAVAAEYEEKYKRLGRKALVSTPDLLKLLPSARWQPNIVPLNEAAFLPRFDRQLNPAKVRIAQAPTRKWDKQTEEFSRVCARLREKYPQVESHIIEGLTYRRCLEFKRCCNIVFDHMNGWFGISSLESLAHGIPVVAGIDEWVGKHISDFTGIEENPWVVAKDEGELERELEKLVAAPEERLRIGKHSRSYMEKHWNEERVLEPLLEVYRDL